MTLRILSLVVLFMAGSISIPVQAQTPVLIHEVEFRQNAVEAIDSLYNRNDEAARDILSSWENRYPGHPIWSMMDAMQLWWVVLEDLYDHSHDDQLFEAMKRSDYQAGRILNRESNHPDALIIRALANGYIARHLSNRDEWLSSIRAARKAYSAYQQLMEIEPDFKDNEFVRGMISYYADYIPDEYPIVRTVSWFLPEGDRREGLRKIRKASTEGIFSRPEATYFMGNILLNYEEDYKAAIYYFRQLTSQYPNNGYYRRLLVRTLSNRAMNDEVLTEIDNAMNHWQSKNPGGGDVLKEELYFWQGRALYRLNQHEEALNSFNQAIQIGRDLPNSSERLYYSVSNYYAGLTAERLDQVDEAKKYYGVTLEQQVEGDFKSRARNRLREL